MKGFDDFLLKQAKFRAYLYDVKGTTFWNTIQSLGLGKSFIQIIYFDWNPIVPFVSMAVTMARSNHLWNVHNIKQEWSVRRRPARTVQI